MFFAEPDKQFGKAGFKNGQMRLRIIECVALSTGGEETNKSTLYSIVREADIAGFFNTNEINESI